METRGRTLCFCMQEVHGRVLWLYLNTEEDTIKGSYNKDHPPQQKMQVCCGPVGDPTVDDTNPALPTIRNVA